MSDYTDYMEDNFFSQKVSLQMDLLDFQSFIKDYGSKRYEYPAWRTRDGKDIHIYKMSDSHIDNTLKYLKKSYDNNANWWIKLLECEKRYRKLIHAKTEISKMRSIMNKCF